MRSRPNTARALVIALLLAVSGGTAVYTQHHGLRHYLATRRYEARYYLPPPGWLAVFSLGHREALAGVIWLRSLLYFADEIVHRGEVEHLYNYADAMLSLDPHFKRVYSWVASCAIYRTGKVTDADVEKSIAYLERAVRLFPDDGELAWALGGNYLYELAPAMPEGPAKQEVKRKGLEQLAVAARMGAGPAWLGLTTATELRKLGQREREIEHLQDIYDKVSDPQVKAGIEERLAALRDQTFAEAFRHANQEFEAARARHFPYLDSGLYMLVGPRPAFDGRALLQHGFDPESEQLAQDDDASLDLP